VPSWRRAKRLARMVGTPAYSSPRLPSRVVPSGELLPKRNIVVLDCQADLVCQCVNIVCQHRMSTSYSWTVKQNLCVRLKGWRTEGQNDGGQKEDRRKAYSKHGHAQSLGVFADQCMLNLDVFCKISRSANGARQHFEQIGVVDDKQLDTSVKRSSSQTPSQVKRFANLAVAHNCRQRRGQIFKAYASYVSRNLSRMRSTSSTVLTARMFSCHETPVSLQVSCHQTPHRSSLGAFFLSLHLPQWVLVTGTAIQCGSVWGSWWHYLGEGEVPGRCASSSQSRPLPGNACIKQAVKELRKQVWRQHNQRALYCTNSSAIAAESTALLQRRRALQERQRALQERQRALQERQRALQEQQRALQERQRALQERRRALQERQRALQERQRALQERRRALQERRRALQERRRALPCWRSSSNESPLRLAQLCKHVTRACQMTLTEGFGRSVAYALCTNTVIVSTLCGANSGPEARGDKATRWHGKLGRDT
jgi:predicted  nucleic acid-binding Zn-ribbon protein